MGIFDGQFNKAKAIAGAAFLAGAAPALSQDIPKNNTIEQSAPENKDSKTVKPFIRLDLSDVQIPKFDIDSVYSENKEINDGNFEVTTMLDDSVHNRTIGAHFKINEISNIKVVSHTEDGSSLKEKFVNIDELAQKYPEYVVTIKNAYTDNYDLYVKDFSWNKILTEREKTLSEDCSNFSLWPELLQLVEEQAVIKNNGGVTDGYDQFYHYLLGDNSPEHRYRFYERFNLKPETIAMHLTLNHYSPLLKNYPLEQK